MHRSGWLLSSALCLTTIVSFGSLVIAQENAEDDLIQLVVDLLNDSDQDIRALAFEQVRAEAKGEHATLQFSAQLPNLPPDTQVGLIRALADRGDHVARAAVLGTLVSDSEPVRVAALAALGLLGEDQDAPQLIGFLSSRTADERAAARRSLEQIPDDGVSSTIAARLSTSPPDLRVTLIEILAARRATTTVPELLAWTVDANPSVRGAAMAALGQLASANAADLTSMVQGVLKAERGAEQAAAEKAVMFVCQREVDTARRAEPLLAVIRRLPSEKQTIMLSTVGRVGGAAALPGIREAISHRDPAQHSAGIRAIANWPDATIAPLLIQLAKQDEHPGHRTTLLRALIRVAPLPDQRTDLERLALLQQAMAMCKQARERNLVIERARAVRIVETLRFVTPYLGQTPYAQQACETIVELAHHRGLREPHKAEFDQALDKVIEISHNATVVDRARRYQNNQTWVRPTSTAQP